MEFIDNKLRRYTTFSKRKTGIMKKAYELSTLTGIRLLNLIKLRLSSEMFSTIPVEDSVVEPE
jgi:hypothetical protein